jgi:hypothetical protein
MKIGFDVDEKSKDQEGSELGTAEITEEENESFWDSVHSIISTGILVIRDTYRLFKSGKRPD